MLLALPAQLIAPTLLAPLTAASMMAWNVLGAAHRSTRAVCQCSIALSRRIIANPAEISLRSIGCSLDCFFLENKTPFPSVWLNFYWTEQVIFSWGRNFQFCPDTMSEEENPSEVETGTEDDALSGFIAVQTQLHLDEWTQKFNKLPAHIRKVFKIHGVGKKPRGVKKEKRKPYPGEPAKPLTSWQRFCSLKRDELAEKKKAGTHQGVNNEFTYCKNLWKNAPEKQKLTNEANADMARYARDLDKFYAEHPQYEDHRKTRTGKRKVAAPAPETPAAPPIKVKAEAKKRGKAEASAKAVISREKSSKAAVAAVPDEDDEGDF